MFDQIRKNFKVLSAVWRKRVYQSADKRPPRTLTSLAGWAMDRMIYPLAPKWATQRMATRMSFEVAERRVDKLAGRSFAAARDEEHRSGRWIVSRLSPDSALEEDLRELQDRCSEMVRNNIVASAAVEARVANEVGSGLNPQPMVKAFPGRLTREQAARLNEDLKEIYKEWSRKGVDRSRMLSLPQMQRQVNRCIAIYGEAFVIFGVAPRRGPLDLAVEIITPERIESPPEKYGDPNCIMGVQYDDRGEVVVGYWVRSEHPGEQSIRYSYEYTYVPRFDSLGKPQMVHVFEPVFPGQSRGIPWMASSLNRMKDIEDMVEAELVNKQIEACMGVFITGGMNGVSPQQTAEAYAVDTDADGNRVEELYPGMVNYLEDGQTVSTIDPNRPGTTFMPFIEQGLRSIASSLNMPYELLAKNFIRVTYSSGRLAMLDGRLGFRMRTQTLKDQLLCPLNELVVWESIVTGVVRDDLIVEYNQDPWIFERHDWRGRNSGLLDPEKERKGHAIGLENQLDSRASIKGEEAVDIEDLEQELLMEGKMQIDREVELAKYRMDMESAVGLMAGESRGMEQPATEPTEAEERDMEGAVDE